MIIKTKHFGEVEVDEENILEFPEGIFGFEEFRKFVILFDQEVEDSPFCWLQSLENQETALPVINPMSFFPEYNPEVAGELVEKIGEPIIEDINLFTVVVVPEDVKKMTTNLKAPILVNVKTKKGMQVIAHDDQYAIKHNLYEQIKNLQEAGE
ncbi:MAG: flagellar assembly protein FliW [Firmicutes bacterium HGW-Firmicutes-1]|jgi:flagellar assembly factor FliW|nr:MAG: flagellar assembly protein FliW [Firmicutes bacterium HGW-Firmicutes-1]